MAASLVFFDIPELSPTPVYNERNRDEHILSPQSCKLKIRDIII